MDMVEIGGGVFVDTIQNLFHLRSISNRMWSSTKVIKVRYCVGYWFGVGREDWRVVWERGGGGVTTAFSCS